MANEGRGDVKAQGLLGACLTKENATRAEALVWLERAANGGDPDAQARLAAYYAHAAMPDWTAARMWVLVHGRAAVRAVPADPVDPHLVGEIAAHLSPGDETEAQTRAQSWQLSVWTPNPDAADEGVPAPRNRWTVPWAADRWARPGWWPLDLSQRRLDLLARGDEPAHGFDRLREHRLSASSIGNSITCSAPPAPMTMGTPT